MEKQKLTLNWNLNLKTKNIIWSYVCVYGLNIINRPKRVHIKFCTNITRLIIFIRTTWYYKCLVGNEQLKKVFWSFRSLKNLIIKYIQ